MKKRNKKKKSLLLLILTMLLTLSFGGVATFAWFTANKTVTISPIQVNVEAQGGIQISADGTNWKTIVGAPELLSVQDSGGTYEDGLNQIPAILEAVSSATVRDANGLMEMWYGTVDSPAGDYVLSAVKDTETAGNAGKFIAFDLFFRSDSATPLYLTPNSNVVVPGIEEDTGIKNATRVAFINKGVLPVGSGVGAIQAINAGATSPVFLWEPNFNSHSAAAISHAFDTYGLTVTDDGDSVSYSGIKAAISTPILVGQGTAAANSALFNAMTPNYQTAEGFTTGIQVFSLPQGISKLRLYMWIEGQDVDCENVASGGNAIFNVQLTTIAP